MNAQANIFAELKEVEYRTNLSDSLEIFDADSLLNGDLSSRSSFLLRFNEDEYALSQWTSPKRTRTFPFERVYNTLCRKNRVALIPFCKDEGFDGDRDFIQWDTISLMSLLNVHVIVCFYTKAEKNMRPKQSHKHKITKQILDYKYIHRKLDELQQYHSSALHWNSKQIEELPEIVELTLNSYRRISEQLKVKMHNENGIKKRQKKIEESANKFKELSRNLAQRAQHRESLTIQPKEKVIGGKSTITMKNLLGGEYYFTTDEYFVLDGRVFLVEKKHSNQKRFPSVYDIKDAFIKIVLFSNIKELILNGSKMPYLSVVGLTSKTLQSVFHSKMKEQEIIKFFNDNNMDKRSQDLVRKIVIESQQNKFGVFAINEKDAYAMQEDILRALV